MKRDLLYDYINMRLDVDNFKHRTSKYQIMISFIIIHTAISVSGFDIFSTECQHTVNCINTLLERYLSVQQTLIISMPKFIANKHDVFHSLKPESHNKGNIEFVLNNLFKSSNTPLVLFKTTDNILEPSFQQTLTNVYYLIIPPSDGGIYKNMVSQIDQLEQMECLNPKSRFILLIIDQQSILPSHIASLIFTELLDKYFIVDILLVTASGKDIIYFYSWFPYHASGGHPVLLHQSNSSYNTCILDDSNLFPEKFPNKFNTRQITASVYSAEPLTKLSRSYLDNGTTKYILEGSEIDVFKIIMNHLNISFNFIYPSDMLRKDHVPLIEAGMKVIVGEADILLGGVCVNINARESLDNTIIYYVSKDKWYVPCPKQVPRIKKVSQIYSTSVWLLMALIFLLTILVSWMYARQSTERERSSYKSFMRCGMNVWAVIMGLSAYQMPRTFCLRILFISFVWFSYAITTIFQTFFTSYLVDPGLTKQIETLEELIDSRLPLGTANVYIFNFDDDWRYLYINEHREDCYDYEACLLRVMEEGDFATLRSEFYAEYFVKTKMSKRKYRLCSITEPFLTQFSTIYMTKNIPYLRSINKVLRRTIEAGIISKLVQKSLTAQSYNVSTEHENMEQESTSDDFFVFTLEHMNVAFYALFLGYGLSLLTFLLELIYKKMFEP